MRRALVLVLTLVFVALAPGLAEAKPKKPTAAQQSKAREHYQQGKAYQEAGQFEEAAKEYLAAYELTGLPALLFNVGRAYHLKGDRRLALEYYERFLKEQPEGEGADEAREFVASINRELEAERVRAEEEARKRAEEAERKRVDEARRAEEARKAEEERARIQAERGQVEVERKKAEEERKKAEEARRQAEEARKAEEARAAAAGRVELVPTAPTIAPQPRHRKESAAARWIWIGAGVALVAVGAVVDNLPDSASNGEVDPLDFVPVGLYGLGLAGLGIGVF